MTFPQMQDFKVKVLLVDDQAIIAEAVQKMLANQSDIDFYYCNDPSKALQKAAEVQPTVILQDLVMPDIDGLLLVKYYRANAGTKDIPLIVLSTKEEPKIKAEAFALGANDYMVKLPDKIELIARIRYHSSSYIRLLQRNEAYEKLNESQQILNKELMEAAAYVTSLLPAPIPSDKAVRGVSAYWRFIPSTQLGGDAFGYHWVDPNHFCIYLLDVCGHGVGAAVLSISVMNVLRAQSLPNVDFLDPSSVLGALNVTFPMEQHNNMFFTMWYGVYDVAKKEIVYASGGHPPAIFMTGKNQSKFTAHELTTKDLVVGGMEGAKFHSQKCTLKQYSKLFVFSDGVYEIARPDGTTLPLKEFTDFLFTLSLTKKDNLEEILQFVKELNGPGPFVDDVSILEINFE